MSKLATSLSLPSHSLSRSLSQHCSLKITLPLDHVSIPVHPRIFEQIFEDSFNRILLSFAFAFARSPSLLSIFHIFRAQLSHQFFFSHASFFFPSSDLRIPRLFLKKKKRKSLLYPIYLICLAISLETCHVNNNAQLYTIRPSFTAAYLGIFQKKKKYASRFTNPDSTNSRVLACDSTRRHAGNRPPPLVPLLVVRHEGEIAIDRSIDRSIDRCQSIERK